MRNALRSLWAEPRAPDNPGILWWDRWLVAALIIGAIVEGVLRDDVLWRPLAIVVAVALGLTLLWRRTHPLTVVAITFGAVIVTSLVTLIGSHPSFGLYTMAFVLLLPYALHRWGSGREIVLGLGIIVVGFSAGIGVDFTTVGEAVGGFVVLMSPALIGAAVRYRAYARSRDRDQVVLKEREQLARELHDTVAHHVSAIAIRAQAGRTLAASNPEAPLDALQVIEEEASRTLVEMRAMVGALRQGEEAELSPLPGVADIARLARGIYEPRVQVELSGSLDDLAPVVDAAVYRLAQESITNAIKHARHATMVDVSIAGDGRFVRMTVSDDGETTPGAGDLEPGFGLLGMNERAKLLGGTLDAGPRPDRGWVVSAVLPKNGTGR